MQVTYLSPPLPDGELCEGKRHALFIPADAGPRLIRTNNLHWDSDTWQASWFTPQASGQIHGYDRWSREFLSSYTARAKEEIFSLRTITMLKQFWEIWLSEDLFSKENKLEWIGEKESVFNPGNNIRQREASHLFMPRNRKLVQVQIPSDNGHANGCYHSFRLNI